VVAPGTDVTNGAGAASSFSLVGVGEGMTLGMLVGVLVGVEVGVGRGGVCVGRFSFSGFSGQGFPALSRQLCAPTCCGGNIDISTATSRLATAKINPSLPLMLPPKLNLQRMPSSQVSLTPLRRKAMTFRQLP
jgi:hypothetical protein